MTKNKEYGTQNGKNPTSNKLKDFKDKKNGATEGEGAADYRTATPGWLAAAIIAVTDEGGAIQFGYSRDGGIYTVVILLDGEIDKNYVKQSEGIDAFCERIHAAFTTELSKG